MWTTYAALQSLTTAMERTGSKEPADLANDLKTGKPVETVMGPLSWDDKGDLKGFEFGILNGMRMVPLPQSNNKNSRTIDKNSRTISF